MAYLVLIIFILNKWYVRYIPQNFCQKNSPNSFGTEALCLEWDLVRVRYAFLSVHCSLSVTCWERANLLILLCVIFYCVFIFFVLSCVVSWVMCGICLYRILIFAPLLTLSITKVIVSSKIYDKRDYFILK